MKCVLAKKIGMTRVFDEDGRDFAVTRVSALDSKVTQIKNTEKDGYQAIQITTYKNSQQDKILKQIEFKENQITKFKIGDSINASQFKKDEIIEVSGVTKGKGFAGTIKRHGFQRGPAAHGSKNVRKPGSIGGGYPQRVVKGKKMAGNIGRENRTIKNLKIFDVLDSEILIYGAIPGPNKAIIKLYGKGEKAQEVIDHVAEEEKLAQERMLEAEKIDKNKEPNVGGEKTKPEDSQKVDNSPEKPADETSGDK